MSHRPSALRRSQSPSCLLRSLRCGLLLYALPMLTKASDAFVVVPVLAFAALRRLDLNCSNLAPLMLREFE